MRVEEHSALANKMAEIIRLIVELVSPAEVFVEERPDSRVLRVEIKVKDLEPFKRGGVSLVLKELFDFYEKKFGWMISLSIK